MHPLVRNLYKRLLVTGREYPPGLDFVRDKAKRDFRARAHLTDEVEIRRAVAFGRYLDREMKAVIGLKKYRTLRARYG
jgi:hypothetical protein